MTKNTLPSGASQKKPPTSENHSLWESCIAQLAKDLTPEQIKAWIRPLTATFDEGENKLILCADSRYKLTCVKDQYSGKISTILSNLTGAPVKLELTTLAKKTPSRVRIQTNSNQETSVPAFSASNATTDTSPFKAGQLKNYLDPRLTFESLVEGTSNRVARAAALHVATAPNHMYNPLFIYGKVGLGKTHLMNAIGNELIANKPNAKILYLHAEQFVSDVVKSFQRKAFDEFKDLYHSLDLLLIDDVQSFANKERTQEEFFNAFEALLAKKSHIVMTSDTYPKGLPAISERLISRFDSGLSVAIEPPELEMRVAILLSKAELEKVDLPDDVAFFIAKNIRSNVRELEGALRKLVAYTKFNREEISIPAAKEALKDLLSIQNQNISIENIQKTVADFYKIKVADMYSQKRPANIAKPRQIAMFLTKELTKKSLPEIGDAFGGRDHTTVLHAVRKITAERQKIPELNHQIHVLEQTLRG